MATRVREYNFVVGPETSTLPDAGTPTDPADAVTLQYADANYVQGKAAAADLTALKAIGSSARKDNDAIYVDSLNAWFTFDSASAATGDDIFVVQPTSGTGRWIRSNQNPSVAIAITSKEQSGDPSTPASGFQVLYPKTDGKWYSKDDAGIVTQIGTGSGSGGINYLSANPNAETDTAGWSTFADAAASTPADMTGGSANSTWTRSTSSPLRGLASFLWTKAGSANRQGEGVSYAITLDSADANKMMQISFDVDATDSSYTDDELTVWVYDVTNATLIYPAFQKIKKAKYSFQTTFATTGSTSYRFGVYTSGTSTANYAIKFDNFVVGPNLSSLGVPKSLPTTFTMNITAASGGFTKATSPAIDKAEWYRDGSDMIISYEYRQTASTGASAGTGQYYFAIPTGYTIDSTRVNIDTSYATGRLLGVASGFRTTINGVSGFAFAATSTQIGLALGNETSAVGSIGSTYFDISATVWNVQFIVRVPITEWAGSEVYLSQAQPEYASNSGTWDADDSSSFVRGPQGSALGGALTASRVKRVRFPTAIQSTDSWAVQFSTDRTCWPPANMSKVNNIVVIPGSDSAGNISAGVYIERVSGSTTDVDVTFGRYANIANDDSPATDWPSTNAFWRVVKIPGQVQVASPVVASGPFMSDISATALGYKSYQHGTTYNGGNAPTVTLSAGGGTLSSVVYSRFIPYQMQDGEWRLKFNFRTTVSSTARTTVDFTIAGITFGADMSISGDANGLAGSTPLAAIALSGTGAVRLAHASASTTAYDFSGDVFLSSKPTWAY